MYMYIYICVYVYMYMHMCIWVLWSLRALPGCHGHQGIAAPPGDPPAAQQLCRPHAMPNGGCFGGCWAQNTTIILTS